MGKQDFTLDRKQNIKCQKGTGRGHSSCAGPWVLGPHHGEQTNNYRVREDCQPACRFSERKVHISCKNLSHSGGVHAVKMSVFPWLTHALMEAINCPAEFWAEPDLRYLSLPEQGSVREFIKHRENRLNGSPARLSHPIWKRIYLKPIVIAAVRSQCQRKRIKGAGQKIQLAFQVGGGQNTLLRKCCPDNRKSARCWFDLLKYKFFPCVKDTMQQKCFQEKKWYLQEYIIWCLWFASK